MMEQKSPVLAKRTFGQANLETSTSFFGVGNDTLNKTNSIVGKRFRTNNDGEGSSDEHSDDSDLF